MPACLYNDLVAGNVGCPYLNIPKNFLIALLLEAIDLISAHQQSNQFMILFLSVPDTWNTHRLFSRSFIS